MSVTTVDGRCRSPEPHTPPASPSKDSITKRVESVRESLKMGSSPYKTSFSPKRPSRSLFNVTNGSVQTQEPNKYSPERSVLAEGLQKSSLTESDELELRESGIGNAIVQLFPNLANPKKHPSHSSVAIVQKGKHLSEAKKPDLSITGQGIQTRSKSLEANRKALSDLISRCETQFFEYAKKNSAKKEALNFIDFKETFGLLRDTFISIESKDFLDSYITRDSQVGDNKDPKRRAAVEAFHAKILKLKEELVKIGIEDLKEGESINFWSGREGKQRASDDVSSFSDSDVPMLKFLFDCWGHIKNREMNRDTPNPFLTSVLPRLFSSIFASHAKGVVNVYMSSKNQPNEKESVINIDSAFWSSELYLLSLNKEVTAVNLYLHKGKNVKGEDVWTPPINLKSTDEKVVAYRDSITNLSKRGDSTLKVSVGTVKSIGLLWKEKAISSRLLSDSDC